MRETSQKDLIPSGFCSNRIATAFRRGVTYLAAIAVGLAVTASANAQVGTGGLVFFGDRVIKESIASTAPVAQLQGGKWFSVGLRADGSVAAWGYNFYGQCNVPKGLTGVTQVATGIGHTLLLTSSGKVKAFGWNNYGQCDVPPDLSNVVQIAAGEYNSVALKSDGTIVVWGWLAANLGPPAGLTNVVQIGAGEAHMVALKSDGSVVCWGQNTHNECNYPGGPNNVVSISVNYEHSAALRSDGTVTCWGADNYNESDVPPGLQGVTKIACGDRHTIASKTDGTVVGWGSNDSGESTIPSTLSNITNVFAGADASYAVDGKGRLYGWGDSAYGQTTIPSAMYDVAKISTGWGHVLLLKHDGSLGAWGRNNELQCDLANTLPSGYTNVTGGAFHSGASGSPIPGQDLFGNNTWLQLSVPPALGPSINQYWAFGGCTYAHLTAGGVLGYGQNAYGQLGLVNQGDFTQITGGNYHTIGLKANGTVLTAGTGTDGQLDVPAGLSNVVQVSAGYASSMALEGNGTVAAWGLNDAGQSTPPLGLSGIVQIGSGHEHSVALQSNGSVVCWGSNASGQTAVPAGLTGIVQIGAGEYFTVCLPAVSLSVSPYSVFGTKSAIGTVYIPSSAPAAGTTILLSSSSPYASVPSLVLIPSGKTYATFPITTTNPSVLTQPVITASIGNLSEASLLSIQPTAFTMVTSIPAVVGGSTQPVTLSVTLAQPAPVGGATINVTSSDPSLTVPSQIVVAAGTQTKQVTLSDLRVKVPTAVTITGSYSNTVATDAFTVNPFQLTFFSVVPGTAVAGNTTVATVVISSVTSSPVTVQLVSSNNAAVAGPLTLTVPANANVGTLSITAGSVTTNTSLTLTANLDGSSILRDIAVVPAVAISTNVPSAVGGSTDPASVTVTLPVPAPAGGASVTLKSSDPSITFNSPVVVPAGKTSLVVVMQPIRVHTMKVVALSATYGVSTAQTGFDVMPFKVTSVVMNPPLIDGGGTTSASVGLNATPTSSVVVSLTSSNNSVVPGPISVTVSPNFSHGFGNVPTLPVATNTTVTLTANLDGSSYGTQVVVDAALLKIALGTTSAFGATFVTGTITLEIPAPFGGLTGNLTSVNGQLSTSKWAVAAGQTTGTFQVATNDVSAAAQMSVTATLGPQSLTASTALQPNRITSFVVSPTTFIGLSRTKVVGTISIAAPVAYDVYVNGTSTKSGLAALPGLITIPAGTSSATVTLTHGKANTTTVVTVTATRAGASKAVNLTVK